MHDPENTDVKLQHIQADLHETPKNSTLKQSRESFATANNRGAPRGRV